MESCFLRARQGAKEEEGPRPTRSSFEVLRPLADTESTHYPVSGRPFGRLIRTPCTSVQHAAADTLMSNVLYRLDRQVERWKYLLGEGDGAPCCTTAKQGGNEKEATSIVDLTEQFQNRNSWADAELAHKEGNAAMEQAFLQDQQRIKKLEQELNEVMRAYQAAVQRAEWAEGVVLQRSSSSKPQSTAPLRDSNSKTTEEQNETTRSQNDSLPTVQLSGGGGSLRRDSSPFPTFMPSSASKENISQASVESKREDVGSPLSFTFGGSKSVDSARSSVSSPHSITVVRKKKPPNLD